MKKSLRSLLFAVTFSGGSVLFAATPPPPVLSQTAKTLTESCQAAEANARQQLADFETDKATAITDKQAIEAYLQRINGFHIGLDNAYNQAALFQALHPSKAMRENAEACVQALVKINTEFEQSQAVFNQLSQISVPKNQPATQRFVDKLLRSFRRAGVGLEEKQRNAVKQLNNDIVQLGQTFSKNIREDVRSIQLTSVDELAGLPEDFINQHPADKNGQITVTTDYPDLIPFFKYAENDQRRAELYKKTRNRGWPQNEQVLIDLLNKRYQLARLLGYDNYAEYVTEEMMTKSPQTVDHFLGRLSELTAKAAERDSAILLAKLKTIDPDADKIRPWQNSYLNELVRKEKYDIDSRELRQYFNYPKVKDGIFKLVESLFGIEIKPWSATTWHDSVESYGIWDNGQLIARFHLDMHPRDDKYKHAAMFPLMAGVSGQQLPMATLVCNFPDGSKQMEYAQVQTFLHEFGHLLHHSFSGQHAWISQSGINTEWDFVEAPSQMLEEWLWNNDFLKTFAVNPAGQVIPKTLVAKMKAGRDFGKALSVRNQLFYSALSLNYYNRDPSGIDLLAVLKEQKPRYTDAEYVDGTHFYANFGHLYGYSAIYYTYMWSLVIALDMFSEFEKQGQMNPELAQHYRRTVLAPGGSGDAADLVHNFLGRKYGFEAFAARLGN